MIIYDIMQDERLYKLAISTLVELATEQGINASGKDEVFGCIFGRDSFLTILKVLSAYKKNGDSALLPVCKRALLKLIELQGSEVNIESGEEPGKFPHEHREDSFDHLLAGPTPWFVYPSGKLINYDSIDSTPLALIAIYRYWEVTGDEEFLNNSLLAVKSGLEWITTFGDKDMDGLIEFEVPIGRVHGGLTIHSWTDSHESFLQPDGKLPKYPIAPVEVQGYGWLAMKLWSEFFLNKSYEADVFVKNLEVSLINLKKVFNDKFVFTDESGTFLIQALDGDKNQIKTVTGNPLLLLWATFIGENGEIESILNDDVVGQVVERAFLNDMFDEDCGLRTMSSTSPMYNPKENSYHNGSFWPILNGLAWEGLSLWKFTYEADRLRNASVKAFEYFNCPIELFNITNDRIYTPYISSSGQKSCMNQAWSAAALLDMCAIHSAAEVESVAIIDVLPA